MMIITTKQHQQRQQKHRTLTLLRWRHLKQLKMTTLLSLSLALLLSIITTLSPPVHCLKCFTCEFNINYCKEPNCYNNPDICSSNQFSTTLVPLQECPRNCMLKAVTNPAGIVLKWKRLCAPASDLTHGFRCRIDYVFGARIEQCTCDKDFCNHTTTLATPDRLVTMMATLITTLFVSYIFKNIFW